MTKHTVVLVDPDALADLNRQLELIRQRLEVMEAQPRPEWVTIPQYAEMIGRSASTVKRRIRQGKLDVKDESGTRMVRLNQDE